MSKKDLKYQPTERQMDAETLSTDLVQYWRHGVMMGCIPLEMAKQWVREKRFFVITEQAIEERS